MPLAIAAVALALGSTPVHAQEQGGTETETPDENVTWVDVTNQFITNPGFTEGGTGWSTRTNAPNSFNTQYCNAEYYDRAGTCYQTISGLEAGQTYKLTVRGFHRAGGNDNGAAYKAGTEEIKTFLYAGDQQVALKSLYSESKDNTLPDRLNDWPNGMEGMRAYIDKYPDSYLNELEFTATGDPIEIGINNKVRESRWTCFTDFKLYVASGSLYEALQAQIGSMEQLVPELTNAGLKQATTDLSSAIQSYRQQYNEQSSYEDINDAIAEISMQIATANALITAAEEIRPSATSCETFVEKGQAHATINQNLTDLVQTAQNMVETCSLTETAVAELQEAKIKMDTALTNANGWVSLAFVLNKAKALADTIGGLAEEAAYQQVVTDLAAASLDYATVARHVAALNAVSRTAMTPEFLAQASSESPIDFTSFIKNPNVYQAGERTQAANDWNCNKGSADGGDYTNGTLNTELYCYSWTGWKIKESQYSQQLSDLPDGAYKLEAATCTNFGSGNIYLYASIDNANILWNTNFNDNEYTYNEACANLATTTSLTFVVQGGNIHIGVIGNKDTGTGGNGKWWKADNFRLYYIGTPEDLEISVFDAGYATYYAPNAFTMPAGLTGGIVKSVDTTGKTLTIDWCYEQGSTVPALTGIILQGKQGEYKGVYAEAVPAPEGNLLQGTLAAKNIAEAGHLYYKLANDRTNGIGFYWDAENGTSIKNGANKAYLAIEQTTEASKTNFFLWDWEATGIAKTVADEAAPVDVYTLSGIRVRTQVAPAEALDGLQKGIYIVNGKKVIK